jgi:hypothetical protein
LQHAHLVAISLIVFAFTTPLVMARSDYYAASLR